MGGDEVTRWRVSRSKRREAKDWVARGGGGGMVASAANEGVSLGISVGTSRACRRKQFVAAVAEQLDGDVSRRIVVKGESEGNCDGSNPP